MATQEMHRSQEYAQAVAAIMAAMPPEHAAQVYDFARFVQTRKAAPSPIAEKTEEWLNDSEEQMQTEDDLWADALARHQNELLSLREAARAEIDAGATAERSSFQSPQPLPNGWNLASSNPHSIARSLPPRIPMESDVRRALPLIPFSDPSIVMTGCANRVVCLTTARHTNLLFR